MAEVSVIEQLRGQLVIQTYETDPVRAMRAVALWLARNQQNYAMLLPDIKGTMDGGMGYMFRISWIKPLD